MLCSTLSRSLSIIHGFTITEVHSCVGSCGDLILIMYGVNIFLLIWDEPLHILTPGFLIATLRSVDLSYQVNSSYYTTVVTIQHIIAPFVSYSWPATIY